MNRWEVYHEIYISVCTAVFHVTKISEINFMRRISECVPAFNQKGNDPNYVPHMG